MMRTTRSVLDREQKITVEHRTCSQSEVSLRILQGGASVGTPWHLEEDMGRRSPISEYISLHPSITHHKNINPFESKVWEIYFYKEVSLFVHSLKFVNHVWLSFHLYLNYGYTAFKQHLKKKLKILCLILFFPLRYRNAIHWKIILSCLYLCY